MRRLALLVAAAVAAIAPAAASAKPPEGSKSDPRAVQSMHNLAACLAGRHDRDARALLAVDFRNQAYSRGLRSFSRRDPDCTRDLKNKRLFINSMLFAGGLAEALLRRDLAGRPLAALTAYDPNRPNVEARSASEYFAICVVRTDPVGTWRLLSSEPAGRDEAEAVQALGPVLGGCLKAGEKSSFTREAMRALLALGAWRLATHNAAPRGGAE